MTAPPRRRVTAPATGRRRTGPAAGAPSPAEATPVYLASLVRAQLRLAIAVALGFVASAAAAAIAIATIPALHEHEIAGVPLDWLLQAYGLYPLVVLFAVVYLAGAARNEARWRALEGEP